MNSDYYLFLVYHHPSGRLFVIANVLVMICLIALFLSIILDFIMFHKQEYINKRKKSIVETGTMFMFFLFYCFLLKRGWGILSVSNISLKNLLIISGTLIIISGTAINIIGRWYLKGNWANQVTVYSNQFLVEKGIYKFIRHPLYSSIIGMFIGSSILYSNISALAATVFIFVPMMIYRAKQEEKLLSELLPGYIEYRNKTGMFLPKCKKYAKSKTSRN
jgi:protein-S-isoprenylcysteine O-methyltransferase Ste14